MENQVSVPQAYFTKTAVRDYSYPAKALVREFLQNSRDAGSTKIDFQISQNNQNYVLVVTDNGCGMNETIIRNKLMALGETTKTDIQVGGFGIAKILLFFAHESYSIKTKNILVEGEGGCYNLTTTQDFINGVQATVVLSNEIIGNYYSVVDISNLFRSEIEKSYLPNIEITIQGKPVFANYKKGRAVESLSDDLTIYKKLSDTTNCYASLRVNGLHMFEFYVGETKQELIIELTGYSTEYLTTNRDGLRGDWRSKIDHACQGFILNSEKGNRSSIQIFKGESSRYSDAFVESFKENLRKINYIFQNEDSTNISSRLEELQEEVEEQIACAEISTKDKKVLITKIFQIYSDAKECFNKTQSWAMKDCSNFMTNHYYVEMRGKQRKLPPKWEPSNFGQSQKMILELWAKILKMVLADADLYDVEFNVGYLLDDESDGVVLANFRKHNNGFLFLLNPKKYNDEKRLPIHANRRTELIMWLLSLATHEVTHARRFDLHNENFIAAEASLRAKTYLRIKDYLKLK